MKRRQLVLLVGVFAFYVIWAHTARAGDAQLPRLDDAASWVAHRHVHVYCENDWTDWVSMTAGRYAAFTPTEVEGFSDEASSTVYVNPVICSTLRALVGREDVGTYYASEALLTLAHEAVHQRGVLDEGVTDCTALPLVPSLATRFFNIRATVTARGRRVPNPWLARLVRDAHRWHTYKPLSYQGGC